MNVFLRFFSLGAQDADRRVAAALAPQPSDAGDRYLKASGLVSVIDRGTHRLREWWIASETSRIVAALQVDFLADSYRSIAITLLLAVSAHVVLTLAQGPRPGWFWMVIPGMTALFAALVLAGSRSSQSH